MTTTHAHNGLTFSDGPLTVEELKALWLYYSSPSGASIDRILTENNLLRLLDAIAEQDSPEGAYVEKLTAEYARHINILHGN